MKNVQDVLIVGGGVIGVCIAYYLLKEGRHVTILEQNQLCSGSSYGNAGLIVPSHSIPLPRPGAVKKALKWTLDPSSPFYVKPKLDLKLLSWLWQFRSASSRKRMVRSVRILLDLSLASIELYDELVENESLDCSYKKNGLLMLYRTKQGFEEGLEEADLMKNNGLCMEIMEGSEIHALDSDIRPDIVGGIYYRKDGNLNPFQFVTSLASRIRTLGANIKEQTKVLDIYSSKNGITKIRTLTKNYYAKHVVIAAGSWSPHLLNNFSFNLPIIPAKGYSVTFEKPTSALRIPAILGEIKVGVNPMGSMMRLAGTLELTGFDFSENPRRINAMVKATNDYIFSLRKIQDIPKNLWSGLRPVAPDGLPVIGSYEKHPNIIVATGHAMIGMTLGPITGKIVSEMVCDQPLSLDVSSITPNRF